MYVKVTDLLWGDSLEDTVNYPLYHVMLVDSSASLVYIQLIVLHTPIRQSLLFKQLKK